ncbi:MAG: hypothetical protein ACYS0G_06660 [Planctomycetota bacterium]|jgi:hypothetical protein
MRVLSVDAHRLSPTQIRHARPVRTPDEHAASTKTDKAPGVIRRLEAGRRPSLLLVPSLAVLVLGGCTFVRVTTTEPGGARRQTVVVNHQVRRAPPEPGHDVAKPPQMPAPRPDAGASPPEHRQAHGDRQTPPPAVGKGPPAHAPAHGYRRKFRYAYYPQAQIYYAPDRNRYFWIEGDTHKSGSEPPASITIEPADAVVIELESESPLTHHTEVVKKHPGRGKAKGKGTDKARGKAKNKAKGNAKAPPKGEG